MEYAPSVVCESPSNCLPSRDPERDPAQMFNYRFPDPRRVESVGLDSMDMPLQDWTVNQLGRPAQPADGNQDSKESSSCLLWLGANAGRSVFGDPTEEQAGSNDDTDLWQCGYNLWDWDHRDVYPPSVQIIKEALQRARSMPSHFKEPGEAWDDEALSRSRRQRSDIHFAGGRGC